MAMCKRLPIRIIRERQVNSLDISAGRMGSRNKCYVVKSKDGKAEDDKQLNTWTASIAMSPISHSAIPS